MASDLVNEATVLCLLFCHQKHRIFLHCHRNKRQTFSRNRTGVQKMASECVQQTGVNCGLIKQNGSSNCICPHDAPDSNLTCKIM